VRAVWQDGAAMTLKERVVAALAEAGFADATVTGADDDPVIENLGEGWWFNDRIAYRAFRTAGAPLVGCYSCWQARVPCDHG